MKMLITSVAGVELSTLPLQVVCGLCNQAFGQQNLANFTNSFDAVKIVVFIWFTRVPNLTLLLADF